MKTILKYRMSCTFLFYFIFLTKKFIHKMLLCRACYLYSYYYVIIIYSYFCFCHPVMRVLLRTGLQGRGVVCMSDSGMNCVLTNKSNNRWVKPNKCNSEKIHFQTSTVEYRSLSLWLLIASIASSQLQFFFVCCLCATSLMWNGMLL